MSEWKQYKPKLAFYGVLDNPNGVPVEAALKRAEAAMEGHREAAMQALGEAVQKLDLRCRAGGAADSAGIYALSLDVLNIAGIFHPSLCRAASSLCDLTQRMQAAGRWDWPSVAVHISSMRLLADMPDETAPGVKQVLSGLASVVAKFPDPHPAQPRKAG